MYKFFKYWPYYLYFALVLLGLPLLRALFDNYQATGFMIATIYIYFPLLVLAGGFIFGLRHGFQVQPFPVLLVLVVATMTLHFNLKLDVALMWQDLVFPGLYYGVACLLGMFIGNLIAKRSKA